MNRLIETIKDAAMDAAYNIIDEKSLNFGVQKALDILIELKVEDEKIRQLLVKHFDIKYSDASRVLEEAKDYYKRKS